MKKHIEDYYALAGLLGDDIKIVALLIQITRLKPSNPIINKLTNLKLDDLEAELDKCLDLKTDTLRDLFQVLKRNEDEKEDKENE